MSDSVTYPSDPRLVFYPDPVLRRICDPVTVFDDELTRFVEAMFRVMREEVGVGLAAPQVGVTRRIFVTNHTGYGEDVLPDQRVWINPQLVATNGSTSYEEGCLSIPAVFGKVQRFNEVAVRYQDLQGAEHQTRLNVEASDFLGIVLQHENDHLDGILHIDHIDAPTLNLNRRKLQDLEKRYKKAHGRRGAVLRR